MGAVGLRARGRWSALAQDFFREPPFVSNSAVKVSLIALTCMYAAGDVRRRGTLVLIVIAVHLVSIAAMASMLLFAETERTVDIGIAEPPCPPCCGRRWRSTA